MTEHTVWVSGGVCTQCDQPVWFWLGGMGFGPHMEIDACEHVKPQLEYARHLDRVDPVMRNAYVTAERSRRLVEAIRDASHDVNEHIPSRVRHRAYDLEEAVNEPH